MSVQNTCRENRVVFKRGKVIDSRLIVIKLLGQGGYGDVYLCKDQFDRKKYAIKTEYTSALKRGLENEYNILCKLEECHYIPRNLRWGDFEDFCYMQMNVYGMSVSDYGKQFDGKKVNPRHLIPIALHMVKAIREIHDKGYIHRDIKPSNFLISGDFSSPLVIIDFGLARTFRDDEGKIKKPSPRPHFGGTKKYVSLNLHRGKDSSMADDLYSWFYSIVELWKGRLPWFNLRDKDEIGKLKESIPPEDLCSEMHGNFVSIYKHIYDLKYYSEPDYDYIIEMLEEVGEYLYQDTPRVEEELVWREVFSVALPEPKNRSERRNNIGPGRASVKTLLAANSAANAAANNALNVAGSTAFNTAASSALNAAASSAFNVAVSTAFNTAASSALNAAASSAFNVAGSTAFDTAASSGINTAAGTAFNTAASSAYNAAANAAYRAAVNTPFKPAANIPFKPAANTVANTSLNAPINAAAYTSHNTAANAAAYTSHNTAANSVANTSANAPINASPKATPNTAANRENRPQNIDRRPRNVNRKPDTGTRRPMRTGQSRNAGSSSSLRRARGEDRRGRPVRRSAGSHNTSSRVSRVRSAADMSTEASGHARQSHESSSRRNVKTSSYRTHSNSGRDHSKPASSEQKYRSESEFNQSESIATERVNDRKTNVHCCLI